MEVFLRNSPEIDEENRSKKKLSINKVVIEVDGKDNKSKINNSK